jgi:hypothetical protein
MHRLVRLLVACVLHLSLLVSSVCWLASHTTKIIAWSAVAGHEYSLACMPEGWLLQQTQDAALKRLYGQSLGFRTFAVAPAGADVQWTVVLSDGRLWLPLPGVLIYQNPIGAAAVRIIAIRHWLCFTSIAAFSIAWQWYEHRRRRPTPAITEDRHASSHS